MSDEIKTGEQALTDGRGKIELPEVIEIIRSKPELIPFVDPAGVFSTENTLELAGVYADLFASPPIGLPASVLALTDVVAEHEKGSITTAKIAGDVLGVELVSEVLDLGEDFSSKRPENKLGTQNFCPLKDACNHQSAEYCKQAKLEADHRRDCPKGPLCDCFHPARGIPGVFRSSSDWSIG